MIKNSIFLSGSLFLILMFSIVVVSFLSNDSCAKIFFVNKKSNSYSIENRCIPVKKISNNYLDYLVDDFLLGATLPEFTSPFPKDSKRKNSIRENGKIYLDFSVSTFDDCEDISLGVNLLRKTVRINKDVDCIFLSVEGKFYNYIGNYGSLKEGI
jgi:hypothetical protein